MVSDTLRFCGACGASRRAGAAFCEGCGARLDVDRSAVSVPVEGARPSTPPRADDAASHPPPVDAASSASSGLRPAQWVICAAAMVGVSLILPWMTLLSFSFSPLTALDQGGYWLFVVGASAAVVGLAAAIITSAVRERSRSLWTWAAVAFGATAALAVLFLVSYASAGSRGGLGGLPIRATGIGIGYFVYAVGSVGA